MWNYNLELYHHGIKGQKWGVRRFQNEDGSLTQAGKKRIKTYSDDYTKATELRKRKPEELSNSELKVLNERTRLEQEYSRLNPSAMKKAMKYTAGVAAAAGTAVALINNSEQLIKHAEKFVNKITK